MLQTFSGPEGMDKFPNHVSFEEFEEITLNFSAEREFAQGPYGRFYWGWAKDGQRVSVMLLDADMARLGTKELMQDLKKLGNYNHPNLVRLFAYFHFSGKSTTALCLEDLPNGSLHRHLSDASNGLDWRTRYKIIKGICEASKHIHVGSKNPILHVLLEPRNILLDENMEPKLVALGSLQISCGAYDGKYLAPEYADTRVVDHKKGYIFSLGVVMMEIMRGPMDHIAISDIGDPHFIDQVQENWRIRMQQTNSGPELDFCCQQVKRCTKIAFRCMDSDVHRRPNIKEIINKLNYTGRKIGHKEFVWLPEQGRYVRSREMDPRLNQILSSAADKSCSTICEVNAALETQQEQPDCNSDCEHLLSAGAIVNLVGLEGSPKGSKEAGREQKTTSVFRDIEKRFKDPEFQNTVRMFEKMKPGKASPFYSMNKSGLMLTPKESNSESSLKSPIVIRKPAESANLSIKVNSSVVQQMNEGSGKKNPGMYIGNVTDEMYIGQLKLLEHAVDGSEPASSISFAVLQLITNNFSDELIIGRGGCGVVYKGILTNRIIAVKKLFNRHTFDDKMFHQEVKSMMIVNHQNTVRFLGYCSHTEEKAMELQGNVIMAQIRERLLCFEYIGNGSLQRHLTDELRGLEWHTRYQIIKGICEGLKHLHKEKRIIHMDLKPANILLDDHMVPKITDFGLSRLDDKSQTTSAERFLSLGYCAPEYLDYGKRSAKSDIYSLGVIIMELVTGSKLSPCCTKVYRRWNHRWNKSGEDRQLGHKQVAKCLDLAKRCIQMNPLDRPNICDIISYLNKMDSSDVSDSTECPELEDMLGIEPLEIHLSFELNKQISCSIEVSNDMDDYFAFRISTTSLHPYYINTNKGILPPRSKCGITITLEALPHNQWRDEFSVQSTRVDGSLTDADITGDLFSEQPGKVVDDVNLVVILDVDGPPLPHEE